MKKLNLMNRVKLTGATAFACLFFLAGVAHASIICDNLSSASNGGDPVAGWTLDGWVNLPPLFDSFSSGPVDTTLLDVQLMLRGTPSSGSISVAIYSDSNTSPGTLLHTIGTLSDNLLPSTLSVVDFYTAYPLAADTRYWIEVNSINDSTAVWSWSKDQDALGVAGEYFGHAAYFPGYTTTKDWVYSTNDGAYQLAVITPLPGAVWLLGSGLAGLGLWRGRKRFRA